ncbi:MAG: hypothetical protein WC457_02395 [Patescibacteria group bacterium]
MSKKDKQNGKAGNDNTILCTMCKINHVLPETAWLPHAEVIMEQLGREVETADLINHVICRTCADEIVKVKQPVGHERRSYVYRYGQTCECLETRDARRAAAKRREIAAKARNLVRFSDGGAGAKVGDIVIMKKVG